MPKKSKRTKSPDQIVKDNFMASAAVTSIFFNLFFVISITLFNSSNHLDEPLYEVAYDNLCVDRYSTNLKERLASSPDPNLTKARFDIFCQTGEFSEYFDQAALRYLADLGYY